MGLVDYASSDDSDSDAYHHDEQPPANRRPSMAIAANTPHKSPISSSSPAPPHPPATASTLPPLPPSFHNLYATTVRPFTADLPSLHQGRKRIIPHVEGNWPSHIYLEWHPSPAHHEALSSLLAVLAQDLAPLLTTTTTAAAPLTTLLTSDLGAPLPLHISLSRPFVLRTEQKPAFRAALAHQIARTAVAAPFTLRPQHADSLVWFRSAEGARAFLVLRVRADAADAASAPLMMMNPQLTALLAACNEVVAAQGQPRLYARGDDGDGGGGGGESERVDDAAFHVSLAWSLAEPTDEVRARTAAVFAREEWQRDVLDEIRIPVDCVKVKIGNVVTDVTLAARGTNESGVGGGERNSLFGI